MSRVAKKSKNKSSFDRISNLPDILMEKILECLPLTDAIKTSVLSRNWRRICTRMKRLVFDTSVIDSFDFLTEVRFVRIIERILLLHQCPLEVFIIVIPQYFDLKYLYLNGLFISLSRKGLQYLSISQDSWFRGEFLSIPSYLFDCRELTHLRLVNCALRPPPYFQGFHNLVTLVLSSIDMTSKELSNFISHCPNIETLFLSDILECYSKPLIISAQNLRVLHSKDFVSGMIILKNTPCLTIVTLECLDFDDKQEEVLHKNACTTFELLCSLSTVEELIFDLPLLEIEYNEYNDEEEDEASVKCFEAEGIKGYNLSQLLNVKIAGLTGLRCETMLVNIMLSSCPLLKTLHAELSSNIEIEKEAKMAWELNWCHRLSSDVELMYSNSKSQL